MVDMTFPSQIVVLPVRYNVLFFSASQNHSRAKPRRKSGVWSLESGVQNLPSNDLSGFPAVICHLVFPGQKRFTEGNEGNEEKPFSRKAAKSAKEVKRRGWATVMGINRLRGGLAGMQEDRFREPE
jgi:hypothetical protein